jgi:predicted DCC family thiol-disulfide oxidoreductase YuxK
MSSWQIKVLIDGGCPLCRREADLWRWLDGGRGRIVMENIAAASFDPTEYRLTREQAMEEIHGILPSGTVVRGMEVFRRAYAAVGWGWLLAATSWPLLRPLCDRGYRWFARNRLRFTGREGECGIHCSSPTLHSNLEQGPGVGDGGASR